MTRRAALAATIALAACNEHVQLAGDQLPGLVGLEVAPPAARVAMTELGATERVLFTATGTFVDGSTRDVTLLVDWTADDPFPGAFDEPGSYVASGAAAGHVGIRAAHGDVAATAALTVDITGTIVDGAFPPPATDLFDGATVGTDPMRTPALVYPSHETLFPQGLHRILFQLARGAGNDAVRLRFESDVLHLTVLTGADRWQPDDDQWTLIAASHPGASVEVRLDAAASASPGTIFAGPPERLAFARAPSPDRVYFAAGPAGIVRASFAAAAPVPVIAAPPEPHHALSRDGAALAFDHGGARLAAIALDSRDPLLAPSDIPMGWVAYAPDRTMIVVADKGALTLRDAATGDPIGPDGGRIALPAGMKATHPDWSPDGSAVLVAIATMVDNANIKGGAIARIPFAGGAWGPAETIVPSTGDTDNSFFPRWSPDGTRIAYTHTTSDQRGGKNAELRLVAATGGAPIVLRRASSRAGLADGLDLGGEGPTWTLGADGTAWLAFASPRPYGIVRTMKGPAQVWVTGLDVTTPDGAADPSFAAFWLPAQDIVGASIEPIWAPAPTTTP